MTDMDNEHVFKVQMYVTYSCTIRAESRGGARHVAIQWAAEHFKVERDAVDAVVIAECDCGYSIDSDSPHHTEECPCAIT